MEGGRDDRGSGGWRERKKRGRGGSKEQGRGDALPQPEVPTGAAARLGLPSPQPGLGAEGPVLPAGAGPPRQLGAQVAAERR